MAVRGNGSQRASMQHAIYQMAFCVTHLECEMRANR